MGGSSINDLSTYDSPNVANSLLRFVGIVAMAYRADSIYSMDSKIESVLRVPRTTTSISSGASCRGVGTKPVHGNGSCLLNY